MNKLPQNIEQIMTERFGKDSLISLATCTGNTPHVRTVNAFYEDGAFYVLTHSQSGKMKQIAENPVVAISGEWFTAHGKGTSLGSFNAPKNAEIAQKMRSVFTWIDNGHSNLTDPNTCILRIDLTDGVLMSDGTRYDIWR